LISPLMGPIMGIGLGAAILDFSLIQKATRNIAVAAGLSILTSTVYFYVTPLHEAQSELLARTTPTLWDVLIAFFGGLAGIIAGSRKEKSNAIPGVAIATALMPPLCTAGYGLANGNMYYFLGALYLFFINSVFISVGTFLIVRYLRYPTIVFEDVRAARRIKSYILAFVIVAAVPSIYLAYNVVKRTIFEQNARTFISTEFDFPETQVISQHYTLKDNRGLIDITLYGQKIDEEGLNQIRKKLEKYKLTDCELVVRQGYDKEADMAAAREFERMGEAIKVDILEDLYSQDQEIIQSKDARIRLLEDQLLKFQFKQYPLEDIESELKIQYPGLSTLAIGDMVTSDEDTICHAVVNMKRRIRRADQEKIRSWLQVRTKTDSLIVLFP